MVPGASFLYIFHVTVFGAPTNVFEILLYILAIVAVFARPKWRTISQNEWMIAGFAALVSIIGLLMSPEKQEALGIIKGWVIPALLSVWMISRTIDNNH